MEQKGREQHGHLKGRKSNCYERGTRVDVSGMKRERNGVERTLQDCSEQCLPISRNA